MDATPAELAELKSVFKAECEEHLTALDSLLLKLEQAPENTLVLQETFRRVHSIKGAARMVGYPGLEAVAHSMESMLAGARDGRQHVTPAIISALFEGADGMGDLVRTDMGRSETEPRVQSVLERILLLSGDAGDAGGTTERGRQTAPGESVPVVSQDVVRISAQKVDSLLAFPGELVRELMGEERELRELSMLVESFFDAAEGVRSNVDAQRRQAALERMLALVVKRREHVRLLMSQIGERSLRRSRTLEDLRHGLAGLSMLPFQTILTGMPRLVRDTALEQGKRVELRVLGADVEIGKSVLEKLMEPLIQLVKNSIAHGIETPERRMARGKNPVGTVTIAVTTGTARATIVVEDDGEGVDLARIRAAIVDDGLASEAEAAAMNEAKLLSFLFKPGFSTSERADTIAGRGVGLDIVAERINQLRGTYHVDTRSGRGFSFSLTVPVNLLWSSVLGVRAGEYEACLRLGDIREAAILRPSDVVHIDNRLCATVRGEAVPLLPLAFVGGGDPEITFGLDSQVTALVVEYGGRRAAFIVDELSGVSDVIIKSLPKPLGSLPGIAGCTILSSGRSVCVLDGEFLVQAAHEYNSAGRVRHVQPAVKCSVLVVEDSMTTRTLLRNIMISAVDRGVHFGRRR